MASDGELLKRWRRGEEEAFAALYARYRRPLFLYLLSLVGQVETAEDLLQETFVRLLRRRPGQVNGAGSLRPYLATIARNQATDWARRQKRDTRARRAIGRDRLFAQKPSDATAELTAEEASELLWHLPPAQRETVILRIYLGCSFAQIARVTAVPLNTAVSRYRYGLEKIRDALQEVYRDAETDA